MPKLEVREIVMEFPSVRALDGVSIAFETGEIHGIIGENGAGKSTLMNILSGVLAPTSGSIQVDGKVVSIAGVRQAQALGIEMIHQELNLVDELAVFENVFLGRESVKGGLLDRPKMIEATEVALKQVKAGFPATAKVSDLSIAEKQLVEIARAVSVDASILIMDEPTAVLSEPESQALFELIARLKERGVTVLYISHRLAEVCAICDRITVLRDGAWIATVPAAGANPADLANLMVGRELRDFYPAKSIPEPSAPILEIRLSNGESLAVSPGEILGVAGLVGAGRTEMAEYIVGVRPSPSLTARPQPKEPEILFRGKPIRIRSPKQAKALGIAYVSEDRKRLGLHTSLPIAWNITLANLRAYGATFPAVNSERQAAEKWKKELDIRAADLSEPVRTLSGGNQQKVSVSKWLDTEPKVLILDEPTRGVDVGAKREMYDLIVKLAQQGLACVVISSDLPEIIGICHRAVVMREGRIVGELRGTDLNEQAVMRLAAGVEAA